MATVHKILTDMERVNEDEPFIASSNTKTRETTGATTQNITMKTQTNQADGLSNEGWTTKESASQGAPWMK